MFRQMPFILLAIILTVILLNPLLPLSLQQFLYAISLSIKSIIIIILPFIIFALLFKAAVTLSNKATKIIGFILILICCSNFIATFLSHYVGMWIYNFDLSMLAPEKSSELNPLWSLEFPKLIANDKAMFAGIILGLIATKFAEKKSTKIANIFDIIVNKVLNWIVYAIPFFVAGFVVKLQSDGVVGIIIKDYGLIFLIIALAQFSYIILAYFILNNLKIKAALNNIKNMIPAAISGFSTMSSAASMPLIIIGAENNAKNKDLVRSVIPASVNIHLIGDCFAIPILAFAILKSFGMSDPSMLNYLIFTCYFVLAKFSVAAIPGGGILVMLPILEGYLGFNSDMMSLITALYILFDPVITCANVFANGAFAKMIDKVISFGHRGKIK
ncbi:MAG: dicarboxylate/amino acid:cation symporter [Rickettsiales bacterium]|nr:dicarboxylate/amino acid:cation symporter [Rickettsiales bacterium]